MYENVFVELEVELSRDDEATPKIEAVCSPPQYNDTRQ